LIDRGVPTVIWDVHGISLTPPADQPGRHVVQVEVLLASSSVKDGWVIVTFDTPAGPSDTLSGPSYLYDLSPSAVRAVQDAVGVAPAGS